MSQPDEDGGRPLDMVFREEAASLAGSKGGSFGQVPEVPEFLLPRDGPKLPPKLVIPVVVPPPRRRKLVEHTWYISVILKLCRDVVSCSCFVLPLQGECVP